MKVIKILKFILLATILFSCAEEKQNKIKDKTTVVKEEFPVKLTLEEILKNRFGKEFTQKIVKFNDGSTIDISKPLDFKKTKNHTSSFYVGDHVESIKRFDLDKKGVILEDNQYHPTSIAKIALKAVNDYKITKSEESKQIFLNHLKWVEDNFYETENYGFWYFLDPAPLYYLEAGWTSSFSQGFLMNVCLEAYHLTNDRKYLIMIEKALKAYMVPVEYGGFKRTWDGDELWFEEYGTERPSRVLNGTIYGLEGVYNVYRDLGSELALKILESGINTIKNHLEDYNAQYISRYSLADWKNEISQEHYHEEHVIQLLWLYEISGDEIFKKYAEIFLESDKGDFMIRTSYKIRTKKILNIKASHSIDTLKHGPKNLTDEIWAYGKFWSSHKESELIVDFGERRENINSITLYHVTQKSSMVNFKLFYFDEETKKWNFVQQFITKDIKDRVSGYNKTGKYETYIEHYKIFEELNTQKLKLVFEANKEKIIAIRELNFNYNRTTELEYVIKKVKERFLEIQK